MNPWEMDFGPDKSEAPPVKEQSVKNPWEMDFGPSEKVQKPSQTILPTRMDYSATMSGKRNVEPSKAPTEASIDEVFPKLIKQESKGKHTDATGNLTKSPVGAQGITQLMPSTAANPGFGIKPVQDQSEGEYLRVGKEYLQALYNKYKDWPKALAAYNAGMGNVEKAVGKAERFGGDWKEYLPKKKETLPYIEKILGGKQ